MKKRIIYLFFLLLGMHSVTNAQTDSTYKNLKLDYLYFSALQGDVSSILKKLDSLSDNKLSKEQLDFKNKYMLRFKSTTEPFDYKTKDTLLISVMKTYQQYWKKVLLKKQPLEDADKELAKTITELIWRSYYKNTGISKDTILADFTGYTEKLFKQKNISIANGKTSDYYDLLVWAKESEVHYNAQLPESETTVKVIFMEDVVTMGWEEFATFGTYFPGGWATPDALYCVKSTYDLNSENFKISYIKHEAQHFADYKLYPNLSGADLEYRAKLVELIYAEKSANGLITFFSSNSSRDRSNSHAFANNCVIRDLSKAIFHQDWVSDPAKWKSISYKEINEKSRTLFKQNSANLQKAGSTVTEFIN
ncbi:MAG: hypothetical protein JWP12_2052 [Bacteroidetes bacterium]|nr:hypothetical protein [Bacteroidota bacterium]